MRLYTIVLILAAYAIVCQAGTVQVPTVYAGPVVSSILNPVTGLNVKLTANNFVLQWSRSLITAVRSERPGLFNTTRLHALVHVAMHDTLQAFEGQFAQYQTGLPTPTTQANVQAAISGAGYTIFAAAFPTFPSISKWNVILFFQQDILRRNGVRDARINAGFTFGAAIANALLASRANDGYNVIPVFTPQTGPGQWRPTPPDFPNPAGQGWGAVTPWGFTGGVTQFYPPTAGNTYFTNPTQYQTDYSETIIRGIDSYQNFTLSPLQRSAAETFIGTFWSNDFGGTALPPGQYLDIAQFYATQQKLPRSNYTRLLAHFGLMLANINIVSWAVKYQFTEWRPVAAIREAGTDAFTTTTPVPDWLPLSVTSPAFPDYISGHATFGYGLARLLQSYAGTDSYRYFIPSDSLPTVFARYKTFSDMALDNALSRVFLGVHFRAAVLEASSPGINLANYVYTNLLRAR